MCTSHGSTSFGTFAPQFCTTPLGAGGSGASSDGPQLRGAAYRFASKSHGGGAIFFEGKRLETASWSLLVCTAS